MSSSSLASPPTLEGRAHTLLAQIERHPDRALFEELAKVDPRARGRYRALQARQSQLRLEARLACAGPREALDLQVPRLARELQGILQAERRALQDAYLQDIGGEGQSSLDVLSV